MALGIYFMHGGFTPEKYQEAIKQLDAAGEGSPKGRSSHFALESDGAIQVFDGWDSQEDFDAFGETLVPILTGLGVELGAPMVANVYNAISGERAFPCPHGESDSRAGDHEHLTSVTRSRMFWKFDCMLEAGRRADRSATTRKRRRVAR